MPTKYTIEDSPATKYTVEDSTPTASQNAAAPGFLSRAWNVLNTPVTEFTKSGRAETQKLENLQSGPTSLADLKWRNEHPIQDVVRQYLAGVEERASDSVTPLTAATAALFSAPNAIVSRVAELPGTTQVANVARTAIPVAVGAQGAGQLYQATTDSDIDPDTRMRMILGGGAGLTGAASAMGPVTRSLLEKTAKLREGMVRGVTGTGTSAVKPLVEETQAANEADRNAHMEEAQGAVEKQKGRKEAAIEKGREDAKKFQAEKERVAEENRRNVKAQKDRAALQEKRTKAYRDMQAEVETTRANALKEGNKKYSGINEALSHIKAAPDFLPHAVSNAAESLRGSKTEPTLLRSMESAIKHGEAPSYADLQGDYSALGKEISKGNLSGDVFHAYDQLHEAIGDEMQRIADSQGQGEALIAARNYWRRIKQAFGKQFNPSDVATNTMERTAPDVARAEEYANRLRLMSNPEWGGQGITKAQATLDALNQADASLPKEAPLRDVVKPNPTRPESLDIFGKPIVPSDTARTIARDVTDRPVDRKIGTKEITETNKEALRKFDNRVKQRGFWIASGAAGYKLLSDVLHGRLMAVPGDIAEGALALGTVQAVARMLENPEVVEMLSRPTDTQIRSIPPELRGDLRPVVQQAQRQGIKVDPRIAALVGASTGVVGPQTRRLQEIRDGQSNTP